MISIENYQNIVSLSMSDEANTGSVSSREFLLATFDNV